jgi:hypothetical protein
MIKSHTIIIGSLVTVLILGTSTVVAQDSQEAAIQDCTPKPFVILLPYKKGSAVAADVLEGKTFTNKDDVDIPGTMVDNPAMTYIPGTTDQSIPEGYHDGTGSVAGSENLNPSNIISGITIYGVTGTVQKRSCDMIYLCTGSYPSCAYDMNPCAVSSGYDSINQLIYYCTWLMDDEACFYLSLCSTKEDLCEAL